MLVAGLLLISTLAPGQLPTPLIDLGDDELLQRAPQLTGIHFDRDQALVRSVLQPALESVSQSFDKFAAISAAEQISEIRLDSGGATVRSVAERFRYTAAMPKDSLEVREQRLGKRRQADEGGRQQLCRR